jgi:hypothetical protein
MLHRGDAFERGIELGHLPLRQPPPFRRMPALILKQNRDFRERESAGLGALEDRDAVENRDLIPALAGGAHRPGQQSGALVETNRGGPQSGSFRDLPNRHRPFDFTAGTTP